MIKTKFKGKSKLSVKEMNEKGMKHDDGWVIGNLIVNGNNPLIVGNLIEFDEEYIIHEQWCSVHPESVGQYTGLKDKNGTEVYKGDVVECLAEDHSSFVNFRDGVFGLESRFGFYPFSEIHGEMRVVGNIHDMKLLEEF